MHKIGPGRGEIKELFVSVLTTEMLGWGIVIIVWFVVVVVVIVVVVEVVVVVGGVTAGIEVFA